MGVKRNAPSVPPGMCVSVGPTSPGMALTLLIRDAQSETSGTRSLSSSGSMQSASPSPSVSVKPSSTRPSQSRSEEHTSELQSRSDLVCRLLLEKKKSQHQQPYVYTR